MSAERPDGATVAWAKEAGSGLPLVRVRGHWFHGTPSPSVLAAALGRAERRR